MQKLRSIMTLKYNKASIFTVNTIDKYCDKCYNGFVQDEEGKSAKST